jgi:putative FmdB family regulatory protein
MPLYDYSCKFCEYEYEVFQKMADPPKCYCPRCGRPSLVRLIGTPALRTATTFVSGKGTLLDQFQGDEAEVARVVSEAKKQGYTPKDTDIYEPCLAQRKGDPAAFLPAADPVGKLKQVCARRNISCEGRGVTIKSKQVEPKQRRKLAAAGAT